MRFSIFNFQFSIAFVLLACVWVVGAEEKGDLLAWQRLPDLPRGVNGPFVGVSNGALIVAGGAYFQGSLFEGGKKFWSDEVSLLEPGQDLSAAPGTAQAGKWRTGFKLHRPLAYGASVTTNDGLVCIGGGDVEKHSAEVFRLRWVKGVIEVTNLPPLPQPCAFLGAALLGSTVYVAGGQDSPQATTPLKNFWALDLSQAKPSWKTLEPPPSAPRILPVVAAQAGAVYFTGGCEIMPGPDGKPKRRYLREGCRFRPGRGWERMADLPTPVNAGPYISDGKSLILVFSGDDGALSERIWELKDKHPGFTRDVLAYDADRDAWTKVGAIPLGLVATTATRWQDTIVIPSGEDRPGHRSPQVLQAKTGK